MYFIIGVIFGSFFCVVSERFPLRKNFWSARSCCPTCERTLVFYELIPILSFFALKGRCRTCHSKIPSIYLFAEIVCGCLFSVLFSPSYLLLHHSKGSLFIWFSMAVLLSLTDVFYMIIDSWMFYSFSVVLWLFLYLEGATFHWWTLGSCLLLFFLFKQSSYIGEGDLLLFISWFPWLSLVQIHLLLLIASSSGIVVYLLKKGRRNATVTQLPFVPFLSLGLFFCLL